MHLLRRLLTALVLASACLSSQEFRGSILGRISDSSGAVIPGASISIVNEVTGVRTESRANAEGNYNLAFVLPGTYTVRVQTEGFKAGVRTGIVVQINDRIQLDFTMEVGAAAEAITVTAPPAVDKSKGPRPPPGGIGPLRCDCPED